MSREDDWAAAVAAAKEAYGKIDGLVNNAGILRFNELVDTPLDEFQQVVQVNQVGCLPRHQDRRARRSRRPAAARS